MSNTTMITEVLSRGEYKDSRSQAKISIEAFNTGAIYLKSFSDLEKFAEKVGFTFELHSETTQVWKTEYALFGKIMHKERDVSVRLYTTDFDLVESHQYCMDWDNLPKNAQPVYMYESGYFVKCYVVMQENRMLVIYRPNINNNFLYGGV